MPEDNSPNFVFADASDYMITSAFDPPPLHMDHIKKTIVELKKNARIYVRNQFGHLLEITARSEGLAVRNLTKHPCIYKAQAAPKVVFTDNQPREIFNESNLIFGELEDEN